MPRKPSLKTAEVVEVKPVAVDAPVTVFPETTLKKEVVVSASEKENFLKCLMADISYTEATTLFGDKLTVKFKSLSVAEHNSVFEQIVADQEKGLAKNNDGYFTTILLYRLAVSLIEVNGKSFSEVTAENTPTVEGSSFVVARKELLNEWPSFKLSGVIDAFNNFQDKLVVLTKNAQDPNFWTAAV